MVSMVNLLIERKLGAYRLGEIDALRRRRRIHSCVRMRLHCPRVCGCPCTGGVQN